MTKKADQLVTVRLPRGVADEIRAITGQPVSTIGRSLLINFLNLRKRDIAIAAAPQESTTDEH